MLGAVLAGGAGRRIGGAKAMRPLAGRPLVSYPLAALAEACERVVVIAKPDTELPPEVERWVEPAKPRHPLAGIVWAVERAGAPTLVCAGDMPFVSAGACRALIAAHEGAATVAVADGRLEPLLAVYAPAALPALRSARPDAPLRRTVASLAPVRVEVDPRIVANVNTAAELEAAERALRA